MIRRTILSFALVSLLVVIQSTWLDLISIYGVIPDISLIVIVYISFKNPGIQGQSIGFAAGLLQDSISAAPTRIKCFPENSDSITRKFAIREILYRSFVHAGNIWIHGNSHESIVFKSAVIFFVDHIMVYQFFDKILWVEIAYNALISPILFFALKPLDKYLVQPGNKS